MDLPQKENRSDILSGVCNWSIFTTSLYSSSPVYWKGLIVCLINGDVLQGSVIDLIFSDHLSVLAVAQKIEICTTCSAHVHCTCALHANPEQSYKNTNKKEYKNDHKKERRKIV